MKASNRSLKNQGFTLIELVLALSILASAGLTMCYLSTDAVERTRAFTTNTKMQRLARNKLDEIIYGIEEELDGQYPEHKQMSWSFTASTLEPSEYETDLTLVECRLVLTYDQENGDDEKTLEFQSWVFVDQENHLLQIADQISEDPEGVSRR